MPEMLFIIKKIIGFAIKDQDISNFGIAVMGEGAPVRSLPAINVCVPFVLPAGGGI